MAWGRRAASILQGKLVLHVTPFTGDVLLRAASIFQARKLSGIKFSHGSTEMSGMLPISADSPSSRRARQLRRQT